MVTRPREQELKCFRFKPGDCSSLNLIGRIDRNLQQYLDLTMGDYQWISVQIGSFFYGVLTMTLWSKRFPKGVIAPNPVTTTLLKKFFY